MEAGDRFRALQAEATEALNAADHRTMRRVGQELVEAGEADGDRGVVAWGEYVLGVALIFNNEGASANRLLRRALAAFRERGERVMAARAMMNLAMIENDINLNGSEARRLYEEAAPTIREDGDLKRLAILHGNLGEICRLEGDYAAAIRYARESEAYFRRAGEWPLVVWQLVDIAHYQTLRRDYAAAVQTMHAGYDALRRAEWHPRWVAWYFDVWVILAAKLERWEIAAQLLGFVDRLRSEQNVPRLQLLLPWLSSPTERLASTIDRERLHELFSAGEALTVIEAQALASTVTAEGR